MSDIPNITPDNADHFLRLEQCARSADRLLVQDDEQLLFGGLEKLLVQLKKASQLTPAQGELVQRIEEGTTEYTEHTQINPNTREAIYTSLHAAFPHILPEESPEEGTGEE